MARARRTKVAKATAQQQAMSSDTAARATGQNTLSIAAHGSCAYVALKCGDTSRTWRLDVGRSGIEKSHPLHEVLEALPRMGGMHTHSLMEESEADECEAPEYAKPVVGGSAEVGLLTEDEHEYFLSRCGDLTGILCLRRKEGGGWTAKFSKTMLPRVLSKEAVDAGLLPPDGRSGLPASLEAVVPDEYRYWCAPMEQAKAMRDALVDSGFLSEESIKVVNGDICKVETKYFLYVPPLDPTKDTRAKKTASLGARLADLLPKGARFASNPFEADDWRAALAKADGARNAKSTIVMLSPSTTDVDIFEVAKAAESLRTGWLIECDDTEDARDAVQSVGNTFKLLGEPSRLFCASFTLPARPGVVAVPLAQEVAKAAKYDHIDFTPPEGARTEAERGLSWRREFGRGGTAVGVARARDLARGAEMSPSTIMRMSSYFARHEVDQQGQGWSPGQDGFPSAGRIAWALWGGDAGRSWANKVKAQMEAADKRTEKSLRVVKAHDTDQRYVLGIVLEPDVVDAQGDTYDAHEVRQAAEKFMQEYRNVGLMHKQVINDRVKILESYVAPVAFSMGEDADAVTVPKGTWMMAVRVLDDGLWDQVKTGGITGFSIGGSAIRTPEKVAQ